MIDENKLIDELKRMINSDEVAGYSPAAVIHSACEKVWGQPKVGEWIPVAERLPEIFASVLLTAKMPEDVEYLVYTGCRVSAGFALAGVANSKEYEVTAWMPFPEPYREECTECPLSSTNNGTNGTCDAFVKQEPKRCVEIMTQWEEEHPQKTILREFMEKYPGAPVNDRGIPPDLCPDNLGYSRSDLCGDGSNICVDCWNRPLEDVM